MAGRIESLVEDLVTEILQNSEVELVDVEYVKEREWYLRVYIDKADGIEIEDCQWLSEKLEEKLDELDPIKDNYYLEVSSPGIDRVLKKDSDLKRYLGSTVEITTYVPIDNTKSIVGKLVDFSNTKIDLENKSISREDIAKIRLHVEF